MWEYQVVRRRIIAEGLRVDGRHLNEVRPLYCESGNLPILHGSSLFSRGDTQVLCTVTLGAPGDAQRLDSLVGPPTKRFMLHYSFPPFSINEVGKRVGLNRREVGHGTLAEKALLAVLPPEEEFPYTVRINSEVMASDGSTSMATVCGGSMALMDAGIPLREHVAGISVGLVTEVDPSTNTIKDYRILTDILGLEDHLGDMDFKIAGTRKGITAIQLDIKPAGIPLDIICECLEPALRGRLQILDRMEQEINAPPTLKFSNDSLRRLLGPMGALKRKIEEETGARISVSDGTLTVVAKNQSVMDKVQEKVFLPFSASGLRINLAKSEIILVGEVEEILELAKRTKGGLGLRKIAILNRALLGKWIWRFACEKDNLWKQVITTKYGQEDHGWRSKKASGVVGVGAWKEILKESDWDATIEEMWDQNSGQGDWNLVFLRDFNDWELDMVGELLHTLRSRRPSLEEYSVMWRSIWVDRVPTKVAFFAWETMWGKVLTLDRL
ncbi:Polyribonucleotide nucleotidyltransferase 2, mitochondrial [Vitis vinifera]|uniref:Polyribonucleotide nucleotidyltransferase 2, mitochondrial n=1 Tax=Vitis vinifera TaxID=29760 RepID=A0A438JI99_VITVI|nr:Polyribonucleotide nucleotidyltransferase 2, mitochondrial [Vitis vinifera]